MVKDPRYPSDRVSLCQFKGRAKRACVICDNEVDIGEILPDADGGLQHWVCVPCRATIRHDLVKYDSAEDVSCRGDEISEDSSSSSSEEEGGDGEEHVSGAIWGQ